MGNDNQKVKGKWEEARGRPVSGWVVLAKSGTEKGLERRSIRRASRTNKTNKATNKNKNDRGGVGRGVGRRRSSKGILQMYRGNGTAVRIR